MVNRTKKALIVGINKYIDPNVSSLRYSVNDASVIDSILTDPKRGDFSNEKCILITDKSKNKPLRSNLLSAIQSLAHTADSDDYLLFFFSGHGIEKDGKSYLLPSDARINVLCDTAIPFDWVQTTLAQSKAKAKILILDACHAGIMKGKSESGIMTKGFLDSISSPIEGFAVLSSCKVNESSYEMSDTQHGVFSYFLIEGLKGAADFDSDGNITISDLSRYTAEKVSDWSFKTQVQQTPNLVYQVVGDLLLTKVPREEVKLQPPVLPTKIVTPVRIPLYQYRLWASEKATGINPHFCGTIANLYDLHEITYEKTDAGEGIKFPSGFYNGEYINLNIQEDEEYEKYEKILSFFVNNQAPSRAFLYFNKNFNLQQLSDWRKLNNFDIVTYDPSVFNKSFAQFLLLAGTYNSMQIILRFFNNAKENRSCLAISKTDEKAFNAKEFATISLSGIKLLLTNNIWL